MADENVYKPIPAIAEWQDVEIDTDQLRVASAHFLHHFESASPEIQNSLLRQVLREAAVESGAIESLYTLKAGVSRIVATETEGWETAFEHEDRQAALDTLDDIVSALEFAAEAVDSGWPLSSSFIRELHKYACKSQKEVKTTVLINGKERIARKPLSHGEFKTSETMSTCVRVCRIDTVRLIRFRRNLPDSVMR
ncbi:Fic family protein [Nocardia farcinica]|uniref:hypothetical protein n=1 Tax=Nocardia farcinica TaxID=37329 RepID=UPI00189397A6|nr:hypothetical protein [Nocardia farcinica]MBF6520574.1 hypothetical protein [Nocardia farcinica]